MTSADQIKRLAEWMGWERSFFAPDSGSWRVGGYIMASCDWNPFERIEDAWMLMEKLRESSPNGVSVFVNYAEEWCCEINSDESHAETAPQAICEAVLKLISQEDMEREEMDGVMG
jgi:hypothetical protein